MTILMNFVIIIFMFDNVLIVGFNTLYLNLI